MKKLLLFLVFAFGLSACSDYAKIVKGSDYSQNFFSANKLYDQKEFSKAIVLYEQIYQHAPKSGEGELSFYRMAQSYYEIEDYYMAQYYYSSYMQRFPYSNKSEEVLFMIAMCSVKNSPEHSLDQTETELAISNVQQFVDRYPGSYLVDTCNQIIDQLHFKLERKAFDAVELYDRTQNYKAAVASAEAFLENYSRSQFVEKAHYILVKNSYFMTINSIESKKSERSAQTNERFRNFALRYASSSYLKELEAYIAALEKNQ
ncbi:MAG: outer membrane protein assembly factor BamD [Sphingomonadales bacterium]